MTKMTLIMAAVASTLALAGCASHATMEATPEQQTVVAPAKETCHCRHHHCNKHHHCKHDMKGENSTK